MTCLQTEVFYSWQQVDDELTGVCGDEIGEVVHTVEDQVRAAGL